MTNEDNDYDRLILPCSEYCDKLFAQRFTPGRMLGGFVLVILLVESILLNINNALCYWLYLLWRELKSIFTKQAALLNSYCHIGSAMTNLMGIPIRENIASCSVTTLCSKLL